MISRFLLSIAAALLAGTAATAATIIPAMPPQSDGCYQISTAEELYGFVEIVNGKGNTPGIAAVCGELLRDIVVNENVLNESGRLDRKRASTFAVWKPMTKFSGTFNGNGHVVSGLYSEDITGFFDTIISEDSVVVVKNLGIVDSYFSAGFGAGVLANTISGKAKVQITNFYTLSTIESSAYNPRLGAIASYFGESTHLTVTNCYNAGLLVDYRGKQYSDFFDAWRMDTSKYKISNSYVLKQEGKDYYYYGTAVDSAAFSNGAVAYALREGEGGSIWGQNVGTDKYPGFSGSLVNSAAGRYSVTLHTFEGDTTEYIDTYISGFRIELPEMIWQEGKKFLGWYRDSEFSGTPETAISDTINGDVDYWAKFVGIYWITYHSDGDDFTVYSVPDCVIGTYVPVEPKTDCYLSGKGRELYWGQDVYRDSSIFLGWYDNEELTGSPVDSVRPDETGEKDFYAKWFNLKRPPIDPADSCYEISDVEELYGFSALVNGKFAKGEKHPDYICGKLTQDIVVNKNVLKRNGTLDSARMKEFFPWTTINFYNGVFDGQGHTISGLYANEAVFYADAPDRYSVTSVTIRDLKVKDSFIHGEFNAAGIISTDESYLAFMDIDNTHFDGAIYVTEGGYNYVGGLVSYARERLSIKNSSHRGIISVPNGTGYVGGLVGHSDDFTILLQNSNEGSFEGGWHVGGLVGEISKHFFIANNYNTADIACNKCVANGLIGGYYIQKTGVTADEFYRPRQSFVLNNYSKGSVSTDDYYTGLELKYSGVTFENNYYLTGTRSLDSVGIEAEASAFVDGTVAKALHDYVQKDAAGVEIVGGARGDKWIQGTEYPVFSEDEERNFIQLRDYDDYRKLPTIVLLYTPGLTLPLPIPTANGYDFMGWRYGSELVTEIPATASGDFGVVAVWEEIPSSSSVASSSSVTSSSSVSSSSSVKPASSSVQSSSSSAKSSSSVKSSSSSAKSSSSKVNSSSSKAKSSSSKGKDAIVAVEQVPQFSLTVVGRGVQIAGARVGSAYAVLDMQGRVLESGRVNNANFNLVMKRAATYLVRVGSQTQVVKIK